jgi:hypothetical protein
MFISNSYVTNYQRVPFGSQRWQFKNVKHPLYTYHIIYLFEWFLASIAVDMTYGQELWEGTMEGTMEILMEILMEIITCRK